MKRCSKCGEEKPASAFWKAAENIGGLRGRCIACDKFAQAKRTVHNRPKNYTDEMLSRMADNNRPAHAQRP